MNSQTSHSCQLNGDVPKTPIKITGDGSRTAKDEEERLFILLILPVFFRKFPCIPGDDTQIQIDYDSF